jgi:hypothetical protein
LKLKIDGNLPADCAFLLRNSGFEADTVVDERLKGADDAAIASRARRKIGCWSHLIWISLTSAPIHAYSTPGLSFSGKRQDKLTVLMLMQRVVLALTNRTPAGELWIVEQDRIRFLRNSESAAVVYSMGQIPDSLQFYTVTLELAHRGE